MGICIISSFWVLLVMLQLWNIVPSNIHIFKVNSYYFLNCSIVMLEMFSVLSNMVTTNHLWLSSISNVPTKTEELKFNFITQF